MEVGLLIVQILFHRHLVIPLNAVYTSPSYFSDPLRDFARLDIDFTIEDNP